MKKICMKCKQEFETKSPQKICNDCKNKKEYINCVYCGKLFEVKRFTDLNKPICAEPQCMLKKRQETNLKKYGNTCSLMGKDQIKKKKQTWINHYGVDNPSKSENIKDKKLESLKKHYGVTSTFSLENNIETRKRTVLKKYGVEYFCNLKRCWGNIRTKETSKEIEIINKIKQLTNKEIIKNTLSVIKNPVTNRQLELDIYVPDLNIAVEYNGEHWHNRNNTEKEDLKTELCKKQEIKLFHIWYDTEEQDIKELLDYIKEVENEI